MDMMSCPHCGAANSTKREYCYQCEGALRGLPKAERNYVATCGSCSRAAVFPPLGQRVTTEQVWCTFREEAVPCSMVSGDCFEQAFAWNRAEILD